ncbi:similar to glucose transporter [Plenodomus lingam JN3]|uniref:Similar to glucose transporter n=1 Tax=Leptosphaeria maculans (strain JN3 / isolate v23.1.3 / race Av1-4-5-6-7-8) TaxID=985895 RepID=E5A8Q5_LEPMJ|nr:similar to glucose transporter [Plenodomus lingam JN3]CBY00000.1 similar to glucose transporter [Plenodomus lingam JN3]
MYTCLSNRRHTAPSPAPFAVYAMNRDSERAVRLSAAHHVYAICGFAAIGGALFGFDISSMSGVLGTQAYSRYFDAPSGTRQGGITAAMPAGSLVGALASSFLADRLSRRNAIQIAALIWIIGAIFQAAANGIPLLCVGRVVGGFAIGICSAIVPVYQSEIAPKEIRGRVVSLQQWAITWGILIQYFIQYGCSFTGGGSKNPNQGTAAFRIPWGIQAVPGAILFIGMFFFPRSPRWLASKDRWEEALETLAHLHGGGDVNHPKVLAEYKEIEEALRFEREEAETSFAALIKPRIVKRVILGMSIQMWSQLCGMNIMMYYIVFIMRGAGIADELLTASIQYIINVAMTLPAILYLDRFGRRPALLVGSFLMAVWLFTTGALQASYGNPNPDPTDKDISWVVPREHSAVSKGIVACSYLFVATFATTWGPTSWTYPSEIFPAKVRAKAVSLATAANWTWNCILAFAVPPLLWSINWQMYMIFGTFNAAAFIHMFLTAPETKGRTLEEMDDVFDSGLPAWKAGKIASRFDQITRDIEKGDLKVAGRAHEEVAVEPKA